MSLSYNVFTIEKFTLTVYTASVQGWPRVFTTVADLPTDSTSNAAGVAKSVAMLFSSVLTVFALCFSYALQLLSLMSSVCI